MVEDSFGRKLGPVAFDVVECPDYIVVNPADFLVPFVKVAPCVCKVCAGSEEAFPDFLADLLETNVGRPKVEVFCAEEEDSVFCGAETARPDCTRAGYSVEYANDCRLAGVGAFVDSVGKVDVENFI